MWEHIVVTPAQSHACIHVHAYAHSHVLTLDLLGLHAHLGSSCHAPLHLLHQPQLQLLNKTLNDYSLVGERQISRGHHNLSYKVFHVGSAQTLSISSTLQSSMYLFSVSFEAVPRW